MDFRIRSKDSFLLIGERQLTAKSGRSAKPIIMQHFYKSMGDLL